MKVSFIHEGVILNLIQIYFLSERKKNLTFPGNQQRTIAYLCFSCTKLIYAYENEYADYN
jgi:hypothetical protein